MAEAGSLIGSCSVRQTREQLQAELIGCQARIDDLERSLAEKGQVKENEGHMASLLVFLTAMLVCWRYTETIWCQIM